jgi:acetyl esterase
LPLDDQVARILEKIRLAEIPDYWQMSVAQARDWHERMAGRLDIAPVPVARSEDRDIEGPEGPVPLRVYTPRLSGSPLPVLLWLHGGGHVVGSVALYDALCRMFAREADCIVVSVEYRLAPEHKFPAAIVDSFAALRWLSEHAADIGGDPQRIALGGDSAGGNLAAVCAILARDAGLAPRFQLLVYPRTASSEDSESHQRLAEGYLLTRKCILWFHEHYCVSEADRQDFRYAPLACSDLSRLPPAQIIVAEYDPLRDEGVAYAEALRRAGNDVELIEFAGMIHSFFSMGGAIAAGRDAHARAVAALRRAFEGT